ncbi:MAG: hypothetical protein JRI97_04725 [Deltaproteobacteria bacterium]|nr:hypothetical protein [Deltaproteobacteria bacterium]
MKRTLFWMAVIALVPLAAWAGMTAIPDSELQEIKGQTGITVSMDLSVGMGDIGWEDGDGFTGAANPGAVVLSGVTIPTMSLSSVTIDAGTTGAGTSYLAIDTGSSNLITGTMIINDVIIGQSLGAAVSSLGKFQISDVAVSFGTIKISGH